MERTSIPCDEETRNLLKELKDESGKKWDPFLRDLADSYESTADNSNEFTIDDIEQGCRNAIRKELPDRVFAGH